MMGSLQLYLEINIYCCYGNLFRLWFSRDATRIVLDFDNNTIWQQWCVEQMTDVSPISHLWRRILRSEVIPLIGNVKDDEFMT